MEPRKNEPRKEPEQRQQERPRRFRIVKLEERIAPCNLHTNPQGKWVGGHCKYG